MKTYIIAGTGHRPPKLGGYSEAALAKLISFASMHLEKIKPTIVISGMALGWDTALACAALELHIPLVAAIPFIGQELMWPAGSQERYKQLLFKAEEVITVSSDGYSVQAMQERNEYMVNNSDLVLALHNGSPGGTGNCVRYANKINKPIKNLWDEWLIF